MGSKLFLLIVQNDKFCCGIIKQAYKLIKSVFKF